MPADDLGERRSRLLGALREPVREPHVQARPLGTREAGVAGVAQERVPVGVARAEQDVLIGPGDEGAADEGVERGLGLLYLEHRECLAREPPPGDGRAPRRSARRRREIVELRCVDRLHRQRQLHLFCRRRETPTSLAGDEDPDPGPGAQQLLDEERVSGRPLGDALDELRGQSLADELTDELLGLAGRQQRQIEPLRGLHPLRPLAEQHRPRARHDEASGCPR